MGQTAAAAFQPLPEIDDATLRSARIVHYPRPTVLRQAIGWTSLALFTSSLVLIPVSVLATVVLTFCKPWIFGPLLAVQLGLAFCPHKKWPLWEQAWCHVFQVWCEILQTTLIFEGGEVPPPQDFMLTVHPHGVIPVVGMLIWGSTQDHGFHPDHFGGSGAALKMPFFRQFLMWNGGVSVSKGSVAATLATASSFSVFSGGIREMMATHNDKETLVLKSRIGIIRLAKDHGKALVPVFAFGCTQHFRRWPSPDAAWLRKLSGHLRAALLVPYGWLGLPIPLFARTTLVFGAPIDVGGSSVEELHERWVAWYADAYERHKQHAGCANRELVIL